MNKEKFKNFALLFLVSLSIILFVNIWYSGKLWSLGYDFFAVFMQNSPEADEPVFAIDSIIMPRSIIITGSGKRRVLNAGSNEYSNCRRTIDNFFSQIDVQTSNYLPATKEDWQTAMKTKSVIVDFGISYSAELLAQVNIPLPEISVKEIVIVPGNSILNKPVIFVKDTKSGGYYKCTSEHQNSDIDEMILKYIKADDVHNIPFAMELGFDTVKLSQTDEINQNILLNPEIIIGLSEISIENITAMVPERLQDVDNDSKYSEKLIKLFGIRSATTRRYIEQGDVMVYVDKRATLKLDPAGLLEYTAEEGGTPLYDALTSQKTEVAKAISAIYNLARNISKASEVSEPTMQLSTSPTLTESGSVIINLDYCHNGVPVVLLNSAGQTVHAVTAEIKDGALVSLRQYIYEIDKTSGITTLSSTVKAVDNLYTMFKDEKAEVQVVDMYPIHVINRSENSAYGAWCAKVGSDNTINIINEE